MDNELFEYFANVHDLILLETELYEIMLICNKEGNKKRFGLESENMHPVIKEAKEIVLNYIDGLDKDKKKIESNEFYIEWIEELSLKNIELEVKLHEIEKRIDIAQDNIIRARSLMDILLSKLCVKCKKL